MHAEQRAAQERRRLEVAEQATEEGAGRGVAGVAAVVVAGVVGMAGTSGSGGGLVVEDDNFVDAEDGEGAGDGASQDGFELDGLRARRRQELGAGRGEMGIGKRTWR